MPRPAKKKTKTSTNSSRGPTNEEKEESDERTFTACHVLRGNWDRELHDKEDSRLEVRRGRMVLDLLEDGKEEHGNGRGDWTWSLETTKLDVRLVRSCSGPSTLRNRLAYLVHHHHDTSCPNSFSELFKGPILSSAHIHIANALIDEALCNVDDIQASHGLYQDAGRHIQKALWSWPCNPAALLSLANLRRMGKLDLSNNKNQTDESRLLQALECYQAAAMCAHLTRRISLELLQSRQTDTDDKFLVETILLDGAKVEEMEDGSYGESDFLVTASGMSALLASVLGRHEVAKHVLLRFSSLLKPITRIHPEVWDTAAAVARGMGRKQSMTKSEPTQAAFIPRVFPGTCPDHLFHTLRHAFRPDAPYWKQSGYDRNVYYSFWTDWPLPRAKKNVNTSEDSYVVSNAVQHYIVQHLLPRIRAISPGHSLHELKGFEWWVHTRPSNGANLGHQLHFDTDEALLDQEDKVEFPISASVTYLNEVDEADSCRYGATILFDQTPNSTQNAATAWLNLPKAKSFLIFPGDLLHGVMPCMTYATNRDAVSHTSQSQGSSDQQVRSAASPLPPPHRLTLMVNFWSYCIPDRLTKQKLYGASSPFPPVTRNHSWTQDIMKGYPQTVSVSTDPHPLLGDPSGDSLDDDTSGLIAVSPAWDPLSTRTDENITSNKSNEFGTDGAAVGRIDDNEWMFPCTELDAPLVMPPSGSGINQRFFVTNAPKFFKSTLNEK